MSGKYNGVQNILMEKNGYCLFLIGQFILQIVLVQIVLKLRHSLENAENIQCFQFKPSPVGDTKEIPS